jgi:hypothetical protein
MLLRAEALRSAGHEITSRWIDGSHESADGDKSRWAEFAEADLDDLMASDTVVAFSEQECFPRGSRHVEFGAALMARKRLVVIGRVENVFMALPGVLVFPTWEQFFDMILAGRS